MAPVAKAGTVWPGAGLKPGPGPERLRPVMYLDPMEFSTFLDHVRADGDRLGQVARDGLSADVPPCPGWKVRDVVEHLAEVYEHKIACTLTGAMPEPWPPEWPADREPLDWLAHAHQRLLALFRERGPEAVSATWWPPDQTVGFWGRRMAHETVIHRVDVELAGDQLSSVDRDLAVDGTDEVLTIFLAGDWSEAPRDDCRGQRILVSTGGRGWGVELLRDSVNVAPPVGGEDAEVSGEPGAVLLWLWGRGTAAGLAQRGDATVAGLLRSRLVQATQ